jgi:hypothetical protein
MQALRERSAVVTMVTGVAAVAIAPYIRQGLACQSAPHARVIPNFK